MNRYKQFNKELEKQGYSNFFYDRVAYWDSQPHVENKNGDIIQLSRHYLNVNSSCIIDIRLHIKCNLISDFLDKYIHYFSYKENDDISDLKIRLFINFKGDYIFIEDFETINDYVTDTWNWYDIT